MTSGQSRLRLRLDASCPLRTTTTSEASAALGAYDPEVYFVASRDKQGHSSSLRINVPVGTMQALGELVASRQYPHLRTPADCHRDALGRWLEWMTKEGGAEQLAATSTLYQLNYQLDQDKELREFNKSVVQKVEEEFRSATTPREIAIARKRADAAVESLEDEAYRFQVEQLIDRYSK